ncbi:MAG: 4a-hydroxytetrahydrobiopterin dehydratase [Candidatus Peregrinibacteria bacterium Gr01-1014_25]|nr:MAG: 4a-hydroxytetrahydrobiopterin dehydratase [Candidatus Peregrinibacteria bacterium Gr01-1014_25]
MSDLPLQKRTCIPCEGGVPSLTREQAAALLRDIPGWGLAEGEPLKIERKWKFKDFTQAIAFVNAVARIADAEDHHPDIAINYSRVTLTLWTHAIGGLSENDFIVAAKVNAVSP